MEQYKILRVYLPTETLGSWFDPAGNMIAKTMELPWRENKRSPDSTLASCIPEGTYYVKKQPPKPGREYGHFRLMNVPGRQGILVHKITFVKDLLGCIGVGSRFTDLNKDGIPDMEASGVKMEWLYQNLPDEFELLIAKKNETT